jgi:hypothetical protein
MPPLVARGRGVFLAAACLAAACSVTRQRVDLAVRGDVPAVDSQGRRLDPRAPKAGGATLARRITAAFRCPHDGRGDHGPQACWEMGERPDREVVWGPLGVAASTLPGVECADLCSKKQISIAPIMAKLGRPPDPADIARRLAPSGPTNDRLRDVVRRAYEEAVRARYRRYADYLDQQLSDADYVEIGPVSGGGATRRYGSGHIYDGLEEALSEIADSYAAFEWTRFEREWGRAPVATRARSPHTAPARRPDSPAAPAPSEEADDAGAAPAATEQADGPAAAPPALRQGEKASATPASTPIAAADDVRCRRSCSLRYRACLARCRDQPITGGEYDACAYECSGGSLACRGACGAVAAP